MAGAINIDEDLYVNDDGTPRSAINNSDTIKSIESNKSPFTQTEEVKGDNEDEALMQFTPCKYNRKTCKYIDIKGNCMAENCLFDKDEQSPLTTDFWTKCIICDKEFSVDPRDMKAYICLSCRQRILLAEKLPFTCLCCGKEIHKPAKMMFSRICDECFTYIICNTGCKNFEKSGAHVPE